MSQPSLYRILARVSVERSAMQRYRLFSVTQNICCIPGPAGVCLRVLFANEKFLRSFCPLPRASAHGNPKDPKKTKASKNPKNLKDLKDPKLLTHGKKNTQNAAQPLYLRRAQPKSHIIAARAPALPPGARHHAHLCKLHRAQATRV